jgi:ABC-type transport system involved in cytochrome c biogenesis permease component
MYMNTGLRKKFGSLLVIPMVVGLLFSGSAVSATTSAGVWVKGDFHTHTYLSDGSYTAAEVAAKAVQYGLD